MTSLLTVIKVLYLVPMGTKTVGGKKSLQYFGPWSWNEFQSDLKLASLIPLRSFMHLF